MKKVSGILWGLVLIAVGVLVALNATGVITQSIFFDGWWTLFIIIPCIIGLICDSDKTGSIIGICVGVFLLLCCQGVLDYSMLWKLLVPIVIVIIGLKLILKNVIPNKGDQVYKNIKENGGDIKNSTAAFGGVRADYSGQKFEGAELNAVFGGVECDLRNAIIQQDCVINASAVFGGITIFAPQNVNIKVKSSSLFGGVSNKTTAHEGAFTIFVNADCIFGGLEIR